MLPGAGRQVGVKTALEQLAICGGVPAFEQPVHVGRPHVGDRRALTRRLDDLLDRGWLTNGGRYEHEFELRLAERLAVEHCVVTCNATIALQILLRALDLRGEVILPAFTFIATAHAVEWEGLTPVFCDVDPQSHNLNPRAVESLVTERTSAILAVHLWGRAAPIAALGDIARRHGLRLIFDAAHAMGCTSSARPIGGNGDAEVFSFHATKVLNSFEGGAITTNNGVLAERLRRLRNFGFTNYDRVEALGTNAKLSEAGAAMGLTSLEGLDGFIAVNRAHYESYRDALDGLAGVTLGQYDPHERGNFHYLPLEIDPDRAALTRDQLQAILWRENVLARRYFHPGCHRQAPYRDRRYAPLPHTEALAQSVLCLPGGAALQDGDAARIAALIRCACAHPDACVRALATPAGAGFNV